MNNLVAIARFQSTDIQFSVSSQPQWKGRNLRKLSLIPNQNRIISWMNFEVSVLARSVRNLYHVTFSWEGMSEMWVKWNKNIYKCFDFFCFCRRFRFRFRSRLPHSEEMYLKIFIMWAVFHLSYTLADCSWMSKQKYFEISLFY